MTEGAFANLERRLHFPVVVISPAGWSQRAEDLQELVSASPADNLDDWQGLEIYDSAGMRFVAGRASIGSPKGQVWVTLRRLANQAIYVALEIDEGTPVSVEALRQRLIAVAALPALSEVATTHQQIIESA